MLKKIIKITLKVVEWLVFAVIVCVFFVSFSPLLPFKNMPKTYVVATGSMIPTIMPGSVSLVLPISPEKLQPKDIIAFKSPENPKNTILHRIDSIKSKEPLIFKTKGDNNNAPDNWDVSSMDVIGKYIISVPLFGHAAAFMKKPLGFALMVVAPALIFIIFQIFNIKKAINDEVERRVKKASEKPKKGEKPDKSDKTTKPVTQIIRSVIILMSIISFSSLICTREILASFSDTVEVNNLAISVKDFVPPPVPTLFSPANNALLNTTGLVMRWNAVTDFGDMHNPVYYYYQSARNSGFSPLAYQSGKLDNNYIPAPGSPDGVYWWHVKACDSIGNCSDWSDPWKVTIDNIAPVVELKNISDDEVVNGDVDIYGLVTDAHPDHYWFVIQDTTNHTVAGPGTVNETSSFTNRKLITWDTTEVSDGEYTVKLEARDAANNKSSTTSVEWLTLWVENDVNVEVLKPKENDSYAVGDTVQVAWKISSYNAPGDKKSTVFVSKDSGTTYDELVSDLKNVYTFDWVISSKSASKTMKIKVIVADSWGNEFTAESGVFDPVEKEDKKDEKPKNEDTAGTTGTTSTVTTSATSVSSSDIEVVKEEPKQENKDESTVDTSTTNNKSDSGDNKSSGAGE